MVRWAILLPLVCKVAFARADAIDDLVAKGEDLAKQREYSQAITAFKEADRSRPTAANACRIGLAYTRRELWSQAEIWLDRCKLRANADDPLPDWFSAAEAQLADKLKGVDTAALAIRVTPANTPALISVSSFPPDETFAPRTIHLVPGTYVITATVPGQPAISETTTVKLGTDNAVTLRFPEPKPIAPVQPAVVERSSAPRYLYIGAGAVTAIGIGFHVLALRERNALQDAQDHNDQKAWRAHSGTFENERAAAIACYGAAAVAIAIGIALGMHDEKRPVVGASLVPGGALVGIEVRR